MKKQTREELEREVRELQQETDMLKMDIQKLNNRLGLIQNISNPNVKL